MALVSSRLILAADASAVSAAVVGGGLGRRRVLDFAREPLDPGALVPSPVGQNVKRPTEVRAALRRASVRLGRGVGPVTLVLPDGIARLTLLEPPRGADAREFVRFRVGSSLPWPAADAVVDVLRAGGDRVVGVVLRRAAVAEYEQLAGSAGLAVERVHLATLLALATLLRAGSAPAVHVLLADATACFVVAGGGRISALHSRRRDRSAGEGERLALEAQRTARLAGDGNAPVRLSLSGVDCVRLRGEIGSVDEGPPEPRVASRWPQAAEAAWLAGFLA